MEEPADSELPPLFIARLQQAYNDALADSAADMTDEKRSTVAGAQCAITDLWTAGVGLVREVVAASHMDEDRVIVSSGSALGSKLIGVDDIMETIRFNTALLGASVLRMVGGIHGLQAEMAALYAERYGLSSAEHAEILAWLITRQQDQLTNIADDAFGVPRATVETRSRPQRAAGGWCTVL